MKNKDCPLCKSCRTVKLCHTKSVDIIFCSSCQNAWTSPPPTEVDYSEEDFHGDNFAAVNKAHAIENLPDTWRKCILMQVDLLCRQLKEGDSILEIGCGEGLLLKQLALRGFVTTGVEPSWAASERGRNNGMNISTGYFPSVAPKEKFDAVILSHVLEHVSDPLRFIREIKLKYPNSSLLFIQTNFKGIIPRFRKQNWYAWAVHQHFWHFTPNGLLNLTRTEGYRQIACEYSSLVHWGRVDSLLMLIGKAIPSLHDQFHLLLAPLLKGKADLKNV